MILIKNWSAKHGPHCINAICLALFHIQKIVGTTNFELFVQGCCKNACPFLVPLALNGWFFAHTFASYVNFIWIWNKSTCSSYRHWVIFSTLKKNLLFLKSLILDAYFSHLGGFSTIFTPKFNANFEPKIKKIGYVIECAQWWRGFLKIL